MVKERQKIEERGDSCVVNRVPYFHSVRRVDDFCRDEQQYQSGNPKRVAGDVGEGMTRFTLFVLRNCHGRDEFHPAPDVVGKHDDAKERVVVFEFRRRDGGQALPLHLADQILRISR